MGKLEELKSFVATLFENSTSKEEIENLAKVNNSISEIEKEQEELTNKNAELIKSYKELVKHTSFKEQPKFTDTASTTAPSFEEALKDFLSKQKSE